MAREIQRLRDRQSESEKITINLGFVDLGHIDLLVREGFYSNRTDFIRTAIRSQLASHADAVKQSIVRHTLELGLRRVSRQELEASRAKGVRLQIQVVGLRRSTRCHAGTRPRDDRIHHGPWGPSRQQRDQVCARRPYPVIAQHSAIAQALEEVRVRSERLVTDDLRSYSAAARELGIEPRHERGRWKNNRAENSPQPTRRRERKMERF